ncbi:MAG: heme A synthase [Gammaproteobacteria bacterium]|nr:heme A synthase [Gammaproteobacteria bacterium]
MPETHSQDQAIVRWLSICLFLIFAMVILGGVTRLTDSGLSMVNWRPLHGILPPLSQQQWQEEFSHYQQSPEFQKINSDMDVSAFKSIFWFEYSHRLLGRLIGIVFLIPFLYFWWRKQIKPGLTPKLIIMFCLGGFQGLLGWYMVKSGLVNNPHVSQYRLTAHLMSAILIYGFILWVMLDLIRVRDYRPLAESNIKPWRGWSLGLTALLLITIVSGGFVAGLDAGLIYNTFPLMGGEWVPQGIAALTPWYQNLFENKVTVQFDHRVLAITTGVLLIGWYLKGRRHFGDNSINSSFKLIGMMVIIQLALGISTLLFKVPVWLAAAHQAGALLLFSAMLMNSHILSRQ